MANFDSFFAAHRHESHRSLFSVLNTRNDSLVDKTITAMVIAFSFYSKVTMAICKTALHFSGAVTDHPIVRTESWSTAKISQNNGNKAAASSRHAEMRPASFLLALRNMADNAYGNAGGWHSAY